VRQARGPLPAAGGEKGEGCSEEKQDDAACCLPPVLYFVDGPGVANDKVCARVYEERAICKDSAHGGDDETDDERDDSQEILDFRFAIFDCARPSKLNLFNRQSQI
jgi:hypothetical protein